MENSVGLQALAVPAGHEIKSEAVFSAIESVPYTLNFRSSSRKILILPVLSIQQRKPVKRHFAVFVAMFEIQKTIRNSAVMIPIFACFYKPS